MQCLPSLCTKAIGGGYAFGDIEVVSSGVDVNTPLGSVQTSVGEGGQGVFGISFGPGIGGSVNETRTSAYAPFRRE